MLPYIAHAVISNVIPLVVGLVAALLVGGMRRPWPLHAVAFLASVFLSIAMQYGGFLVLGGVMTGDWPSEVNLLGLAFWFALFAVMASFTAVPLTAASYATSLAVLEYRTNGRPAN